MHWNYIEEIFEIFKKSDIEIIIQKITRAILCLRFFQILYPSCIWIPASFSLVFIEIQNRPARDISHEFTKRRLLAFFFDDVFVVGKIGHRPLKRCLYLKYLLQNYFQ